jgi:hypothetical protein
MEKGNIIAIKNSIDTIRMYFDGRTLQKILGPTNMRFNNSMQWIMYEAICNNRTSKKQHTLHPTIISNEDYDQLQKIFEQLRKDLPVTNPVASPQTADLNLINQIVIILKKYGYTEEN